MKTWTTIHLNLARHTTDYMLKKNSYIILVNHICTEKKEDDHTVRAYSIINHKFVATGV